MKNSIYNLYTQCNAGILCFNTYQDSYIVMNHPTYNNLIHNKYDEIEPSILENLHTNKFVVEDGIDEYDNLIKEYHENDSSGIFYLTLLTTLDCNVRCWYCFEKHIVGSRLSSSQQDKIFKYAQQTLNRADIHTIHFSLFGGEPMLYFKEEVYPLLAKIKNYALTINKTVRVSIVTNATRINKDTLPLLAELGATFQISIDGYKAKHNSIKKSAEFPHGTYDVVMENIHSITDTYDSRINLRINYDNQTLDHLQEVINDIQDIERRKIRIHLERVWQTHAISKPNNSGLKETIDHILRRNFRLSYLNFDRKSHSCLMDLRNNAVISYNEDVYKCTGRDFTDTHKEGTLMPNGDIVWDQQKLEKRLSAKTFDNPTCRTCKLLPQCWGPCTQKLTETSNIDLSCPLKTMEISMDDYIHYRFNNEFITRMTLGNHNPIEILN